MGEIKAELNAELQTHIAFEIPLFGGIPVPESAVVSWAIIVVLTLLAIWLTHGLRKRPGRKNLRYQGTIAGIEQRQWRQGRSCL